ncbi:MAG: hypothetical protein KKD00_09100, partial [Gammaproteobacteria bacterium]|nr:hypothetical protein [Gammaproteobacteria bacterium]
MGKHLSIIIRLIPAFILLIMAGCDSSDSHHRQEDVKSPVMVSSAYSSLSGSALGGVLQIDADDFSQTKELYIGKGSFLPPTSVNDLSGFVYNETDGRFWGIISNSANKFGSLISFDPTTDKLYVEAQNPAVTLLGHGKPPVLFYSTPVISADGKSLFVVSQGGGRETLTIQTLGDGLLMHINIDRDSPQFGRFTPVYEFYSYGIGIGDQLNGIRNVRSTPVWGEDGAGDPVMFLMSEGEKWVTTGVDGSGEVPAKVFSLGPTDDSDWSKAWEIRSIKDISAPHYLAGRLGNEPAWDDVRKRFIYSFADTSGDVLVHSSGNWVSNLLDPLTFGCFLPRALWMSASNDYDVICRGVDDPDDALP